MSGAAENNRFSNNIKQTNNNSGSRILGLDGLRAVAIIGVILYHMFPTTVKGGFLGVSLFFVLSGYLIAITCEKRRRKRRYGVLEFYKKRLVRIYPPVLITTLVTVGIFFIFARDILPGIGREVLSILLGYNNWWQILQNSSYFTKISNASPFTHMWSLAVELQYYLIWPLIFFWYIFLYKLTVRRKAHVNYGNVLLIILGIISALDMMILFKPGTDATRVYYGTDTRLYALLFGAALGMGFVMRKNDSESDKKADMAAVIPAALIYIILFAFVIISFIFIDGQGTFTYYGGMQLVTLAFCGLIFLTSISWLPFGRIFEWGPLKWIGERSYEMYLWMYPVIFFFSIMKLTDIPGIHVIEFVIIILLSDWEHRLVDLITKKQTISFSGQLLLKFRKAAYAVFTLIATAMLILGTIASITAGPKSNDSKELERQLAENQKMLEDDELSDDNGGMNSASGDLTSNESNEDKEEDVPPVTMIGDSVMLGAAGALKEVLPAHSYISAKESRQVVQAMDIVKRLNKKHKLGNIVVIGLGTNGTFTTDVGQKLIDYIGKDRQIYWINVYGTHLEWEDQSNKAIEKLVKNNDNVQMIDWNSYVKHHKSWLYDDGIHLKPNGQKKYAKMVADALGL